uniref:Uncharacterized protein n=2 Tax=Arion vulgaris TaxID=1028688 RepID=A0A0B7A4I8_9EUPU
MLCCWSPPLFHDPKPLIVDLNDVLNEKAWRNFRGSHGTLQRMMLRRKNYICEVPDNYFDFQDTDQTITPSKKFIIKTPGEKTPIINKTEKSAQDNPSSDSSGLLKGKVPPNRELTK